MTHYDSFRPLGVGSNPKWLCHRIHSRSSHQLGSKMHSCSRKFGGQKSSLSGNSKFVGKNVIVPVPVDQVGQGFYSTFFLVQKKTGGYRPILNLRQLNKFDKRKRFKLDSIRTVKVLLQQGDFTTSLDLKDAYISQLNKRISSEISPVRICGKPLSIQGSSFWTIIEPSSIQVVFF